MLVLTRKVGERIQIGDKIVVTVVRIQNEKVRIGIEAPDDVVILREEVTQRSRQGMRLAHSHPTHDERMN